MCLILLLVKLTNFTTSLGINTKLETKMHIIKARQYVKLIS